MPHCCIDPFFGNVFVICNASAFLINRAGASTVLATHLRTAEMLFSSGWFVCHPEGQGDHARPKLPAFRKAPTHLCSCLVTFSKHRIEISFTSKFPPRFLLQSSVRILASLSTSQHFRNIFQVRNFVLSQLLPSLFRRENQGISTPTVHSLPSLLLFRQKQC